MRTICSTISAIVVAFALTTETAHFGGGGDRISLG